jgi:hypothetical protein
MSVGEPNSGHSPEADAPENCVKRFDGVLVALSGLDREDLLFMAAEEESHGNLEPASYLREIAGQRLGHGESRRAVQAGKARPKAA